MRASILCLLLCVGCATASNTENTYRIDQQTFHTQLSTTNSRRFFAASAVADLATTGIGISRGLHEANPIFGQRSSRSLLFGGLFSIAQYGIAEWLRHLDSDEKANTWLKIFGAVHVGASAWNTIQIERH